MLTRLSITFALGAALCLALAGGVSVPNGVDAARALRAGDDPVALSDRALGKVFDATVAAREIEAALTARDIELARSFVALAAEREVAIAPELIARIEAAERDAAAPSSRLASFARGFITGTPEDVASAAGMLTGDLMVFGDVRDLVREGWHGLRGGEVDKLVVGLAGTGLAVTAGMYASAGLAAPARAGLTVIKAARRGGHIGAPLVRLLKVESREGLTQFAGNLGRLQSRTSMRGALEGVRLAENPQDVAKLARLAEAKGSKTRAIIKVLGRGAIMLTGALFDFALWIFWAFLNLLAFCAACKRAAERMMLRHCERQRMRRLRMRNQGLAAQASVS